MSEIAVVAPKYSILITSYRSLRFLEECLGSVLRSTGPRFELLFLENGSPEPEAEWIAKNLPDPRLHVFQVPKTRFFAGGINYLADRARGEFLVLLNADTRVVPEWLSILDARLQETGFEGMNADVREMARPDREGDEVFSLDPFGRIHHTHISKDGPEPTLMTGGCGMAIRRDVFFEVGGLDGDYKMYFEEIDLCWRVALRGYRIGYAPGSIVHHVGQGSAVRSFFLWNRFRGRRNRIWTFVKNASPRMLLLFVPVYTVSALASIGVNLLKGRIRNAFAEAAALAAAVARLDIALSKRGAIQRTRVVDDAGLASAGFLFFRVKPFEKFLRLFFRRLGHAS